MTNEGNKKCFGLILVDKNKNKYLNLCLCHLNLGLIFAYIYIIASSLSSIITRILFHYYQFKFNFALFFLEQTVCTIIFTFFKRDVKFEFQSFLKYIYFYLSFSAIYILNVLSVFYGHQLVINVSMYFSLKKLTPLMLFFIDCFVGKKKISITTIISIFLLVGGSILVAKDSFTKDYLGCGIVLISNILTITYSKLTEIYHQVTGETNIKLLIYNNYLTLPVLFLGIFLTGEQRRIYKYFSNEENNGSEGTFMGLGFYLFLYGIICSVLTSSFFISNEKNSSFITKLISNTRAIFVTVVLHIFDKNKNKLNLTIFFGLILAIIGSILINIESIYKNINNHKSEENDNNNYNNDNGENNDNINKRNDEIVNIKINNSKDDTIVYIK
jgi:drug/metabolite transporter (DMT)-like permease